MSRTVAVIGDIHGEATLLATLLDTVRTRFGSEVEFYHLGDMIDRGPDSKGVVQLCIDNGIHGILGNHETWLHQVLATGKFDSFALHKMMGGEATLRSYGVPMPCGTDEIERSLKRLVPKPHKDYLLSLPLWRRVTTAGGSFRLTHTGIKQVDAANHLEAASRNAAKFNGDVGDALCDYLAATTPVTMLWTQPNVKDSNLYEFPDGSCQVFGHVPVNSPIITKGWIAVDTGSGTRPPHSLSAVILPSRNVVTVNGLSSRIQPGKINDFSM